MTCMTKDPIIHKQPNVEGVIICVWVPSSCHLTTSSASNGLHDLCKGIKVFIRGSKYSWASSSYQGHVHGFHSMSRTIRGHHHHTRVPWPWQGLQGHQITKCGSKDIFRDSSSSKGLQPPQPHGETSRGQDITREVSRPSLRVPWHHQSMNDHIMDHKCFSNPSRASPTSVRSSGPSPRSSTSLARWWHQDSSLWVHGPCQPGTRCFKIQTHSILDPRHCKVGLGGINDILWGHYKSMLASMPISSTEILCQFFYNDLSSQPFN